MLINNTQEKYLKEIVKKKNTEKFQLLQMKEELIQEYAERMENIEYRLNLINLEEKDLKEGLPD
jgi:uncharacterized hydantoinase/oxoprolinase family protein